MTFYQFLQTWTGRWCLFAVSFIVLVGVVMLGYCVSRETGETIATLAGIGECGALFVLIVGSGTS